MEERKVWGGGVWGSVRSMKKKKLRPKDVVLQSSPGLQCPTWKKYFFVLCYISRARVGEGIFHYSCGAIKIVSCVRLNGHLFAFLFSLTHLFMLTLKSHLLNEHKIRLKPHPPRFR